MLIFDYHFPLVRIKGLIEDSDNSGRDNLCACITGVVSRDGGSIRLYFFDNSKLWGRNLGSGSKWSAKWSANRRS